MNVKIRLHNQEEKAPRYKQVWQDTLTGKNADEAYYALLGLHQDPHMHGEIVSMRFKDGKGGGCQISGSFMEAEFIDNSQTDKEIDAYFGFGKWRSW